YRGEEDRQVHSERALRRRLPAVVLCGRRHNRGGYQGCFQAWYPDSTFRRRKTKFPRRTTFPSKDNIRQFYSKITIYLHTVKREAGSERSRSFCVWQLQMSWQPAIIFYQ